MPIFDYLCHQCGFEFESIVLGSKNPGPCPKCGSMAVQKSMVSLFNCTGVQLTKRLKMESEERMKKGQEMLKKAPLRKDRIKIL